MERKLASLLFVPLARFLHIYMVDRWWDEIVDPSHWPSLPKAVVPHCFWARRFLGLRKGYGEF